MEYPVWVEIGQGGVVKATLADVSETGARVLIDHPSKLPDQVVLRLTEAADPRRPCDVVWTTETQLGLHFDKPAVASKRTVRVA